MIKIFVYLSLFFIASVTAGDNAPLIDSAYTQQSASVDTTNEATPDTDDLNDGAFSRHLWQPPALSRYISLYFSDHRSEHHSRFKLIRAPPSIC